MFILKFNGFNSQNSDKNSIQFSSVGLKYQATVDYDETINKRIILMKDISNNIIKKNDCIIEMENLNAFIMQDFTGKIVENEKSTSTMATRIFTSILRILFDILSVCMFTIFLGLVWLLWIPGWLGGLTAFLPLAYFTNSAIWQLCKQGFILFWTFVWMCLFGWVTIFPVIWQFFYLIYLMFVKQLRDNAGQFGTEFLKRMQSLVYIYVVTALIIAFASTELPNPTKFTVGVVSAIAIGIHAFMNKPKTE